MSQLSGPLTYTPLPSGLVTPTVAPKPLSPSRRAVYGRVSVDLGSLDDPVFVACVEGIDNVVYDVQPHDGGTFPASCTLTVDVSLDGLTWRNPPAGAVTYTTAALQTAIDVSKVRYIRIRVTDAAAASEQCWVVIYGEGCDG